MKMPAPGGRGTASLLLLLSIFSTVERPVAATTLLGADFSELVVAAAAVVHGRIVETRPEWVGNRARIDTLVTLAVDDYYKGNLGRRLVFRVPGGRLGRYRSILIGAPVFTVGQEVILFLDSQGSPVPYVLGLNQGVFRVGSLASGRVAVTPAPLLARGTQPERVVRGDPSRNPLGVQEFAALVRSILASHALQP